VGKKQKKVRWGFQWEKVAAGAGMLLLGGGVALVGWFLGRIILWAMVIAFLGACTMISGLVGEEGIW
jgi:hypothetical protein